MGIPGNVTRISTLKGKVDGTDQTVTVQQYRRKKQKARKIVSMLNVGTMMRLELSNQEYRVLWALLSHIPEKSGSDAYCTQAELAADTGIHPSNVAKVLKGLRDRDIVMTVRRGRYHVNSHIAFNGSFDQWTIEDDGEPMPVWARHGVDPETGEVL
jgi:hypothetical protein